MSWEEIHILNEFEQLFTYEVPMHNRKVILLYHKKKNTQEKKYRVFSQQASETLLSFRERKEASSDIEVHKDSED